MPVTVYSDQNIAAADVNDGTANAPLLNRVLAQYDEVCAAQQEERALMLQDRRFAFIAGAQWEDAWSDQWANGIMVEVNEVALGLQKIVDDYRANRVIVNFRAADDKASEVTADFLDGLFRADVYNSKGQQAFDNAFEEAASGGMGAWELCNEYEDEFDPDNEYQRISFKAVTDADQSVFFDPNARLYDKSDAMWALVVVAMSPAAYERQFNRSAPTSWPNDITKPYYDWYTPTIVRVARYYEVEIKRSKLLTFRNVLIDEEEKHWADDLSDATRADMEAQGWREVRQRMVKRRRVHLWVLSGSEVLEDCGYIAGNQIPIVPVYGQRRFIDNMERVQGHVRKAKDPQRVNNTMISKLVETASIAPIERPIFTPQQIAGHEHSWAVANLNRAPYALVNPLVDESSGQIMGTGPVGKVEPPQLPPVIATLIQYMGDSVRRLTNADDGAGEVRANISAEAMDIAATRTDAKTAIYMDNFRQSMQRCGEIYLSMARDIYVEEGRKADTLGDDGEEGTAVLMEPFTDERGRFMIRNDLSAGRYKVIADVTEATATRRDKTVKTLVNIAQIAGASDPTLAMAALNTALVNMDGEGMKDMQDWVRDRLVQQGILKPTPEEKQQLEEAAANQQPDPQSLALLAMAEKENRLAHKAEADTALSKAKTVETLVGAQAKQAESERDDALALKDITESALAAVQPPKVSPRSYREL